jgi:hypothetical protein
MVTTAFIHLTPADVLAWDMVFTLATRVQLITSLLSVPPPNFSDLPFCYYQSYDVKKYGLEVVHDGATPTPNFIHICPAILKLKHTDGCDVTSQ